MSQLKPAPNRADRISITTRMHPDIKERAQIQAIRERRQLPDLIEDALLLYLDNVKTN